MTIDVDAGFRVYRMHVAVAECYIPVLCWEENRFFISLWQHVSTWINKQVIPLNSTLTHPSDREIAHLFFLAC